MTEPIPNRHLETSDERSEMRWNGEVVRKWLESRFIASQRDQDRADQRGREYEDDCNKDRRLQPWPRNRW